MEEEKEEVLRAIYSKFYTKTRKWVTIYELFTPCLRKLYIGLKYGGTIEALIRALREAAKQPILNALEEAGWRINMPYRRHYWRA